MKQKSKDPVYKSLLDAINTTGELHEVAEQASTVYKHSRVDLYKKFKRSGIIDDWVFTKKFKAALLIEAETTIDPIVFIDHVTNPRLRARLLKVKIGEARKRLSRAVFKIIARKHMAAEPSLNIRKIN